MKLYALTKTIEGSDGIRDFEILLVSDDKPMLRRFLSENVEEDEFGFFSKNGFHTKTVDCAQSNFVDNEGFVSYEIRSVNNDLKGE